MKQQRNKNQETLGEAIEKTETWLERNSKTILYVIVGLIVAAALVFGYRYLIVAPREKKAAEMIAQAQINFEAENYTLALNGEGDSDAQTYGNGSYGLLDVIDQYGSTPTGNLAKHYAGICYLHLGDLENAADYLARYKPMKGVPAQIINAQNYALQGDVAVERDDLTAAVALFDQAIDASTNELTTPLYLQKAALAAQADGQFEKAMAYAQRITDGFPRSTQARDAERLIGSLQK